MIHWASIVLIIFLIGVLSFGWVRRWSMMMTLVVAMSGSFVLGLATTGQFSDSIVRSPVLQDLAWRPQYLALDAWMHWPTALTTMFLHADVTHILMNIVIFAFMGLGFEDRVGRGLFLFVFTVTGVLGTLLHSVTSLDGFASMVPVVGASGAVFGIIGAYATLFPRDKIVLFVFLIIPNVPVYIAAVVYTVLELFALNATGPGDNVARYAHVGGLIMGVLTALALSRAGRIRFADDRSPKATMEVHNELETLVTTAEQRSLYERVLANRDEPEVARAWLEKLARETPCPRCGKMLENVNGTLRSSCGYSLNVSNGRKRRA